MDAFAEAHNLGATRTTLIVNHYLYFHAYYVLVTFITSYFKWSMYNHRIRTMGQCH